MPSVCLNMIVKNEAKIIRRLLSSLFPYIDCYCICDTGSTDDTIQVIRSFFQDQERQIEGEIIHCPFRDFGYNRSYALKSCEDLDADYVLLLDADMKFECKLSPSEFRNALKKDAYYIYQGGPGFLYKNTRIVKNKKGFSYWGVTHEYVQAPYGAQFEAFPVGEVFINDIGDGGSKGNKTQRDIDLLLKGLQELPDNDRYTFYLANSYSDIGDNTNAIKYYEKRIQLGGWVEELWYSHYNIGNCYERMGKLPDAIYHWLEAYQTFPHRIENLYEIVKYYRIQGKNNLAYQFYKLADAVRKANQDRVDFLFYKKHIADYQLDYELSIIGYYENPDLLPLGKVCMKLFASHGLEESYYRNTLSNYKFYANTIFRLRQRFEQKNPVVMEESMTTSTPSIAKLSNGRTVVCTRYVNYHIDDRGNYINQDHITTKNLITVTNQNEICQEFVLGYEERHDGKYIGQEDIRLLCIGDSIYYTCNRGIDQEDGNVRMCVEFGEIDLQTQSCKYSHLLEKENARSTEKNWVLFDAQLDVSHSDSKSMYCVYEWSPLTIGMIHKRTGVFETIHKQESESLPRFFRDLRGSTNGVRIGEEIIFICHLVSYEDRRYYYHCFVALDSKTFQLKRYTPLWRFENDNKVEYTLGFTYGPSTEKVTNTENYYTIGYSTYDKTTKFIDIPEQAVNELFCMGN